MGPLVVTAMVLGSTNLLQAANSIHCEYKDNTKSIIESKITGVRNMVQEVYPYKENTRKCIVKFDAEIDGEWTSTSASKVFDGDISENKACDKAKLKAKKLLLEQLGIEILQNTKNKQCTEIIAKNTCQRYTKMVNVRGQMVEAWGTVCNVDDRWVRE